MHQEIEKKNTAIDLLKNYDGINTYLLALKRDIITYKKVDKLTDFNVDYVLKNINYQIKDINKIVHVIDWYGDELKDKWETDFRIEKVLIKKLLGETDKFYHCFIQYRKNVEPSYAFLKKNGIIGNFLLEDYHNISIDFDRYDRLSMSRTPDKPRKIKNHQKEAVQFLISRKKCILADDMGTGKSTSLTVASIEGNFDAILIICPASLKSNWFNELTNYVSEKDISIIGGVNEMKKNEIEKYLGYGEGKSGKNLNELKEEAKERGKWTDNRYVIINFDILDDVYKVSRAKTKEGIEKAMENSPMLKFLLNKKSLIIIDEAHKLSNNTSDRYKIIKDLINKSNPHSIYLSTGTPITNDPANYFNLLSLLNDPLTIDREFYYMRYCDAFKMPINEQQKQKKQQLTQEFLNSHNKNTWYDLTVEEKKSLNDIINKRVIQKIIPKGGKNLEELKMQTAHVYLRRTKDDIGDLPPKYIHERVFELNKEQMAEYKKLWDEYEAAKLEEDSSKELNKELIEGGIYRKYLSNQMVPNTIKLAEKCLARGEKIVIACCYDDELYTLRDYFKDKCVIYNGKMSLKEKDEAIKRFNNDPNIMVFIGNIIAAGVGITLTSSRVVIFNNFSYVPGDNSQFQDRVHRIGQTRDVHIFYQFFKDTQYEKMWNTVLSKSLIINKVIKKEDEK